MLIVFNSEVNIAFKVKQNNSLEISLLFFLIGDVIHFVTSGM